MWLINLLCKKFGHKIKKDKHGCYRCTRCGKTKVECHV